MNEEKSEEPKSLKKVSMKFELKEGKNQWHKQKMCLTRKT